MAKRSIAGSRAIVTGASSGIGWALAHEMSRCGGRLIVTARREDRLKQLVDEIAAGGGEAHYIAGDVTDASIRAACLDAAATHLGGLDVLVNNAGVGALGPFMEAEPERLRQIMEVNFFAAAEFTRAAYPMLREGNRPIIVNVSSVLGHRAAGRTSEYCASKFALHGLSDALRAELAPEGIDVLLVSPSTTDTEFFESVLERKGKPASVGDSKMSSLRVARKTVRAIRRGKHEIILSAGGKALVWLDRLCPPLANWVVARFG
jgi:short-subunit dehydrogenase